MHAATQLLCFSSKIGFSISDGNFAMSNHLGGAYEQGDANTIMQDVWGYLAINYGVTSVLDVGCGYGYALRWFLDHLITGLGIDGFTDCIEKNLCKGSILLWDFYEGAPVLPQKYDLGWSAEFLEHVDVKYLPNVMAVFKTCKHVCITHGEPGQGGFNHVNCVTDDKWIEHFEVAGFHHLKDETIKLRLSDRWKAPWGRRTLMVFENRND
jgi:SAM-dependent methyltransferase